MYPSGYSGSRYSSLLVADSEDDNSEPLDEVGDTLLCPGDVKSSFDSGFGKPLSEIFVLNAPPVD